MEVWSRIATFLPFSLLLSTFWSLRDAGVLPETHTNASNAFLQFCSGVTNETNAPESSQTYVIRYAFRTALLELGIESDLIDRAVQLCEEREGSVTDYLLRVRFQLS